MSNIERRTTTSLPPTLVYLLWLDYSVVDVYTDVALAFEAAQRFLRASAPEHWLAGKPGRWFGPNGRLLEVEERQVVQTVAGAR